METDFTNEENYIFTTVFPNTGSLDFIFNIENACTLFSKLSGIYVILFIYCGLLKFCGFSLLVLMASHARNSNTKPIIYDFGLKSSSLEVASGLKLHIFLTNDHLEIVLFTLAYFPNSVKLDHSQLYSANRMDN